MFCPLPLPRAPAAAYTTSSFTASSGGITAKRSSPASDARLRFEVLRRESAPIGPGALVDINPPHLDARLALDSQALADVDDLEDSAALELPEHPLAHTPELRNVQGLRLRSSKTLS